jgi:U4/U6.U5 tri-snRNP component SNU23
MAPKRLALPAPPAAAGGKAAAAGVDNTQRKTWDKAEFAARAEARAAKEAEEGEMDARKRKRMGASGLWCGVFLPPFLSLPRPTCADLRPRLPLTLHHPPTTAANDPLHQGLIVERAKLSARDGRIDLAARLNKSQLQSAAAPLSQQAGFYCDVCDCVLKDSLAYLDHINGKWHNRALGTNMEVEQSTVEQVRARLAAAKARRRNGGGAEVGGGGGAAAREGEEGAAAHVPEGLGAAELAREAAEAERAEAREARAAARGEDGGAAKAAAPAPADAADGEEGEEEDPELAAYLGFAGFGGSKKR